MRALLINGSPRGRSSNTLRLAEAFLRGLDCEYETFTLAERPVAPCTGCLRCWSSGGVCVQRDAMDALLALIWASDVIVESFPLYYFGMPAPLKAMTDRTVCLMQPYLGEVPASGRCSFQRPRDSRLLEKHLVLVSTCGYTDAAPMYDALLRQYDLLCDGRNYTPLLFPQGELLSVEQLAVQRSNRLREFEAAGRRYASQFSLPGEVLTALQRPLVDPRVYEILARVHWTGSAESDRTTL